MRVCLLRWFCLRGVGGKFCVQIQYDILTRKYVLDANLGYLVLCLAWVRRGPAAFPYLKPGVWEVRIRYYVLAMSFCKITLLLSIGYKDPMYIFKCICIITQKSKGQWDYLIFSLLTCFSGKNKKQHVTFKRNGKERGKWTTGITFVCSPLKQFSPRTFGAWAPRWGRGRRAPKPKAGVSARVGGGGMARPAVAELERDKMTMSSPCFLLAVLVTTST